MKHVVIVAVAAAILATLASTAVANITATGTPAWPANCSAHGCTNRHLNNLDARLRKQHKLLVALRAQAQAATNQLNCYYHVGVREYGTDGSKGPANQPAFLDFPRGVDSAEYQMVVNFC